jgi:hypothetical protein
MKFEISKVILSEEVQEVEGEPFGVMVVPNGVEIGRAHV